MKFGKYAVIDEVTHHFENEPEWFWKIDPATSGDELAIAKFLVQGRVQLGLDGVRREYPPTNAEVMHREIALLFGGTNIPMSEGGGDPILSRSASVEAVEGVLRDMPNPMVYEIWDAVGRACPGWGPMRPNPPISPIPSGDGETSKGSLGK